jgi:hypothetical protein
LYHHENAKMNRGPSVHAEGVTPQSPGSRSAPWVADHKSKPHREAVQQECGTALRCGKRIGGLQPQVSESAKNLKALRTVTCSLKTLDPRTLIPSYQRTPLAYCKQCLHYMLVMFLSLPATCDLLDDFRTLTRHFDRFIRW